MFTEFVFVLAVWSVVISAAPPRHIKGVQIKNKGNERLWVEMTNEDSFSLPPGQTASIILEDVWSGKIVARSEECQYKKCNAPYTVAELSFGGDTKEDKYRVSVIEGYNKPIKIQPTSPNNFCKSTSCSINLVQACPIVQQIRDESDNVVACKNIAEVFKNLCPQAVASRDENMFSCKTSDNYFIAIG